MNRREILKTAGLLLGSAVSLSVSRAVLAGVQANTVPLATSGLGAETLKMVSAVSDRIIPATDTPGAIAAQVPAFVDLIYQDWYTPAEQAQFNSAGSAFRDLCKKHHHRDFSDCSSDQQDEFLVSCESRSSDEASLEGFYFKALKELTVLGYYTSEVGAKQELSYNPVPMRYKGDYLFADVGKQWSY